MGFNLIFTWNCLKLEVNSTTKDALFFKQCIQVIYLYFKDLPSWVVSFFLLATADGWSNFIIFVSVDTAFSGFKFGTGGSKNLLHIARKTEVVHMA